MIGKEKPAIIDNEGNYRDVSTIVKDFDPSTLNFDTIKKISETDINSFDKQDASSDIKISETMSEEFNSFPNKKVRRNSPCPCGSGKKFKHCCGAI